MISFALVGMNISSQTLIMILLYDVIIISVLFQPVRLRDETGDTHLYVDGGVTNNFPINAFDGRYTYFFKTHAHNLFLEKHMV
jgi:hypothetical protein